MQPTTGNRRVVDPVTGAMEEIRDFIFPDDEKENNPTSFKFLQMAHKWKQAGSSASAVASAAAASTASEASAKGKGKAKQAPVDEDMDSGSESDAASSSAED